MDAALVQHTAAAGESSEEGYDPVFAVRVPPLEPAPQPPTHVPLVQQGLQSILGPLYARGASAEEIQEVTRRAYTFYSQSLIPSPSSLLPV